MKGTDYMLKKSAFLLISLIFLLPTTGFSASWQFDHELAARQKADHLKWVLKNLVEAYKQVGHKDPGWDDLALESLRAYAVWRNKSADRKGDELFIAANSGQKAMSKGCQDPMVMYVVAHTTEEIQNKNKREVVFMYMMAGLTMKNYQYPPARKIYAYLEGANALIQMDSSAEKTREPVIKFLDDTKALFPELVKDSGFTYPKWSYCCRRMRECYRGIGEAPEAAHRHVYEALEKAGAGESLLKTIEGDFWIEYAWQARGNDFKVSSEGRRLAKERLENALKVLVEAWHADPKNDMAPSECISAMLYYGGDRNEMEFCFRHAIENSPRYYYYYGHKLYWLEPKWRGSIREMLDFGRECLATQSWDTEIPFILVEAHKAASRYGSGRYHSLPQQSYFRTEGVWPEIKAVYDEFLERYPKDYKRRCEYAYYASLAGDWETAHREFQAIGDNVYWPAFNDPEHYQALVYQARKHMKAKAAVPESEPKTGD